jgi:hypothetical protein
MVWIYRDNGNVFREGHPAKRVAWLLSNQADGIHPAERGSTSIEIADSITLLVKTNAMGQSQEFVENEDTPIGVKKGPSASADVLAGQKWHVSPDIEHRGSGCLADRVSSFPGRSRITSMKTAASGFVVGAVLLRYDKPLAYESRRMSPAERNYGVGEQELLAVAHAFHVWRCYLEGSTVLVITDHHPNRCSEDRVCIWCMADYRRKEQRPHASEWPVVGWNSRQT